MTNILIVEDDMVTRRILEHTLGRAGYNTLVAADGHEALVHLSTHRVDMILSDIAMPGVSGIQLLEKVRANPDYASLPVVLLTASQDSADRRLAVELDVSAFLTKPMSSSDILRIIEQLVP